VDRRARLTVAVAAASRLRRKLGLATDAPTCSFHLTSPLGVELRFLDLASLEGVYCRRPIPVVVLSSLRPHVRQIFSCGHELAHHLLGDERCVAELIGGREASSKYKLDELAADVFAGQLLMPKSAILKASRKLGRSLNGVSPERVFELSSWFGVGYETLIRQMVALDLLPRADSDRLLRHGAGGVKRSLLGWSERNNVVMMDERWRKPCVHLDEGDLLLVPASWQCPNEPLEPVGRTLESIVLRATARLTARLNDGLPWSTTLYVGRRGFVGRFQYRYLSEG